MENSVAPSWRSTL